MSSSISSETGQPEGAAGSPTPDAPSLRQAPTDQMGGFAKGLAVIEAYGQGKSSLTIAEVARLSGLDRASARRCLLTLVNAGYATTDGRYFELTPRILRLGHTYLAASLPRLIQPTLTRLADELRESCSAAVLDGTDIVYIARAAQHRLVGVGLHPGSRLPAYCSSMGRVLLAALPVEHAVRLIERSDRRRLTEHTMIGLDELSRELDRVRHDGFSIIDQELALGSKSIAVPIHSLTGRTVAAFNVAMHVSAGSAERLHGEVLGHLRDAQSQLAKILP